MGIHHKIKEHIQSIKIPNPRIISKIIFQSPVPEMAPETPSKTSFTPVRRRLNMKRISLILSVIVALVFVVVFITKFNPTALTVKEGGNELPPCTNDCSFEAKICEDGKILECVIGEDGCRHKNVVESCPEGSICSKLKEGTCYTPRTCDFTFHTCITTTSYQLCKDGKSIEGAETQKCPEGLVCNKSPKNFALCVEK